LRVREFSPEELSAFLLQKIKRDAEAFLGEPVTQAIITVPAYFDDNQRSATKDAGRIAGLEVARLVNEPTAASLAYGVDRSGQDLRIAVIDLGGGTLDVTIMEFGKGVFEVKATSGDTQLGGRDMDELLVQHLAAKLKSESDVDGLGERAIEARLREAAEQAKVELSTAATARIALPFLASDPKGPVHFETELTRSELERLVRPVIDRCRAPVSQALHDAGIEAKDVNRIVFVGGPTRMPIVRSFFEELFGREAERGVDPMECVAQGAAIQAGVLTGEVTDIVLVDVTPLTLGIETLGGVATSLIPRNTPIPVKRTEIFTTAADMQTAVTVHVYQGERPMAGDNTSLGQFNLEGLAPAPRGVPKVEVAFDIDADGILNVAAKDMASGRSQSIRITGSTRLSEEDKQTMVAEAERYAEEDKKRRADAEALNAADNTCYQAEKMLADYGDKLDADLKKRIEDALRAARDAVSRKEAELAGQKAEQLKTVLQEAGSRIYAEAKPSEPPHPQPDIGAPSEEARPTGSGPSGRVVDAEYRETGSGNR
jgi:molecular chaperone DnaK